MASWLCSLRPDELPRAQAWTEEASPLGIAAWVVRLPQEPKALAEQWDGLPLVPSVPLPQGCDVAPLLALIQHRTIWRYQGRPLLLLEGRQVCAAAVQRLRREADPWIVSELEGCGEDGVLDRVPLPAAGDRWNYEVLLRQAHWRGGRRVGVSRRCGPCRLRSDGTSSSLQRGGTGAGCGMPASGALSSGTGIPRHRCCWKPGPAIETGGSRTP